MSKKVVQYLPWYNILSGSIGMLLVMYQTFLTNADQNLLQILFFLFYAFILFSGIKFKEDKTSSSQFMLTQVLQILSFRISGVIDYFFCAGMFIGIKIEGLKVSFLLELVKIHFRVVSEVNPPSNLVINFVPIAIIVFLNKKSIRNKLV